MTTAPLSHSAIHCIQLLIKFLYIVENNMYFNIIKEMVIFVFFSKFSFLKYHNIINYLNNDIKYYLKVIILLLNVHFKTLAYFFFFFSRISWYIYTYINKQTLVYI